MTTRGFSGRRPTDAAARRLPPGQYQTDDFPVLAKGPDAARGPRELEDSRSATGRGRWSVGAGPEFEALPQTTWRGDIHCVTKWSKFDTTWQGVTVDDLLAAAGDCAAHRLASGAVARRLRHQRAGRGPGRRQGDDRDALWGRAARSGTRRARAAARSASLFLEEREMDQGPALHTRATKPASGSCAATTCTAIPGASSATRTIHDGGDSRRCARTLAGSGDRAHRAADAARRQCLLRRSARPAPSPVSMSTSGLRRPTGTRRSAATRSRRRPAPHPSNS